MVARKCILRVYEMALGKTHLTDAYDYKYVPVGPDTAVAFYESSRLVPPVLL